MDFMTCIKERRSIRKFKPEAVSETVLKQVVEAASYSPSWKNSQSVRYVAVSDTALKTSLAENCMMDFEYNKKTALRAPMLVLITTVSPRSGFERDGSFSTSKGTHWESFDAGIAAQTFCLAAHELGLGTVILGIFDEAKVIETANLPEGQKVSAIVAVGYADEVPAMPNRKGVDELLTIVK